MFEITYKGLFVFITLAWVVTRATCGIRNHKVNWKYEAKLLTVYICLVVIARIVYFPMRLVEENLLTGHQTMYNLIQICMAIRCTPL